MTTDIKVVVVGVQGVPGRQGIQGPPGVGIAGASGPRGLTGDVGPQGPFGVVGGSGTRNLFAVFADQTTLRPSVLSQEGSNVGLNTLSPDVIFHIGNSGESIRIGLTTNVHIGISDTGLQAWNATHSAPATLYVNNSGGPVSMGGEIVVDTNASGVFAPGVAKLYRSAANGITLTGQSGTSTNSFAIHSGDGTILLSNPVSTNNLTLAPVSGNVSVGSGGVPTNKLEVNGTFRATISSSSYKNITKSGNIASTDDALYTTYVVHAATTDATITDLFLETTNRIPLLASHSYVYSAQVVARRNDGTQSYMSTFSGAVDVDSGGTMVHKEAMSNILHVDNTAWDFAITVDNTNAPNALRLQCEGVAATNIHWVCSVQVTSVG